MLTLALLLTSFGVELPAVRHGDVTARLQVRVAEQGAGPGRGRAALTVTVEGPATLEVEGPRLEDALAAWRVAWQTSSWAGESSATWETTLGLEQIKPGAAPLPGVRLRVRERPGEAWQDVSWLDPLHEARDVAPIVDLPPLPRSAWRERAPLLAAFAILIFGIALFVRRIAQRKTRGAPEPAWRRARTRLDGAAGVETLSLVIREYLQEQGALPATRLTTAELLSLLQARGDVPSTVLADLRPLLELGDLVKFAGRVPTADELQEARQRGARVVEALATWPAGENVAVGEAR